MLCGTAMVINVITALLSRAFNKLEQKLECRDFDFEYELKVMLDCWLYTVFPDF